MSHLLFLSRPQLLAREQPAVHPVVRLVHDRVEFDCCVLHGVTRIAYPSFVVSTVGTLPLPFASGDGKLGCNCVVCLLHPSHLGGTPTFKQWF